jgi:hypothetical protein
MLLFQVHFHYFIMRNFTTTIKWASLSDIKTSSLNPLASSNLLVAIGHSSLISSLSFSTTYGSKPSRLTDQSDLEKAGRVGDRNIMEIGKQLRSFVSYCRQELYTTSTEGGIPAADGPAISIKEWSGATANRSIIEEREEWTSESGSISEVKGHEWHQIDPLWEQTVMQEARKMAPPTAMLKMSQLLTAQRFLSSLLISNSRGDNDSDIVQTAEHEFVKPSLNPTIRTTKACQREHPEHVKMMHTR